MNLPILTAVLLGLVLTPALADYSQQVDNNCQVSVGGVFQNMTLSSQTLVVVIEQRSEHLSWKTIWHYKTGIIATKVMPEGTCYISTMNRNEMPSFESLAKLASQNRNLLGLGRPNRKITFVTSGLVNNLNSYGIDITAMCSGLTTYMAYEVHTPQVTLGSCITLDVLRVLELQYCKGTGNGNGQIPQFPGDFNNGTQVIIGGQSQVVTINMQWRVAIIEQNSISGSWKTIWNYNTGVIATRVTQQNTCYISIMNKNEMPSFNNLARLAQESRNQIGFGRPTKKITFVANGLVNNLRSYGADVFSMCNGLTTYMAYEVHGPQVNLGSCLTLDVLRVVDLKYCTGHGNGQIPQFPGDFNNGTQVIIGGQSQVVTINMQWRVAIIEQNSISGSWKTIWNYNTGVIATRVTQQNTCYISIMNKNEMPSFNNLARLAQESRNQIGFGRPTKKITFVANGLVNNLRSYGADVFSMCNGLTTYMAYEVHGPQVNLGSCLTLDVLRVVDLKYCTGHGNGQIPQFPGDFNNGTQVIIGGQSQVVTINMQWRVAIIEQNSISGSWKTIWNYNTGVIATRVTQQNTCYISIMNKNEMPSFNNLARLAQESRNQIGFGRPTKKITFVANGLVNNLRSYGADVFSMCNGLTTYMAYEVHGPQVNLGSCLTLDVLRVVDLKYCTGHGNGQIPQFPGDFNNGTQVIIGGQSQVVTINMQWRVAIIEQNSISGSWKTIWNYNTGVIATRVTQQNTCYISIMNKNEMPSFNNLARLAQESRNQIGFGRPTKKITFVANGLVNNLRSYGADVFSMCNGLTTYMAYEVHGPQVNLGSCLTLDVLRVVDLKYCTGHGNGQIPQFPGDFNNGTQVIIGGQSQVVTINMQWRVAIIEQNSISGSWKTIWNYNTGVIATRVTQQNTCYISIMNKNEMPSFNNLARLAQESRNQIGFGRPTKKITFVANGLVNNLRSYGADVFSMCNGLTTYMAYEVHGPQVNLGSCLTLDVLRVVDLKYCTGHGNGQIPQFPGDFNNGTQVIIGGQSQVVTINMQWRVAIIEQNSISGSWKTIWNYNTGVIATRVTQQNTCYISIMNKNEMPSFNNLARLAQESRNQIGFGRPTKKITFVANGLVNNLRSYGADVFSMCNGLTTYMAYEVHGPQVNLGSCLTLDVLRVVDLKYCTGHGNGQIPQFPGDFNNGTQVIIGGQSQVVTINMQWRVAIIEQNSISGSWKTIWNYNTGVIATRVTQQNTCYISIMNKNEMPSFNNLARLAQESRNQIGFGRPTKKITFVANGLVNNLRSYGADVFSMCNGLTTYMAYEVHGPQVNLGSCLTLDVLRVVDLKYCTGHGNGQIPQFPGDFNNGTQVIIGGQSQVVTINMQWRVAIIEQNSISGSWKTIWNYNTGVIATRVTQQNTCYISIMNKNEMPSFNNLARLAQESRNQIGFGRPTKKITFVANGLVNNLRSYGADVFSMCNGLTTYMAYEVHGPQVTVGSCIILDVLRVVDLKYCNGNFNGGGQSQQTNHNCHFSGGCIYQNMTVSGQTHVAIFEQRSNQFSWKTIWNYNTGIIATKVVQEGTCYISTMNRNVMPSFDAVVRYASENRNQIGFGRPTKKITFVANGLVNNLSSYGADVFSMCNGLTTYMAYEVHGPQLNQGSCISLDVLKLVDLNYCGGNIKA